MNEVRTPDQVTRPMFDEFRNAFEKHAGFVLSDEEWYRLRRSMFSIVQGHYIHYRDLRIMEGK